MADEKLSLEITFENGQFLVKSKEVEEGFEGIKRKAQSTNSILTSLGGALTKFVTLPMTILGGVMLKSSSDMEQMAVSFEVLLGSASKAKKMMGDLSTMAAATPFETTDLAKSTETMLGFGIASKDIMKNLQMLGDISGGNVNKFNSLTLSFSQMSAAGKLTGGDLLQMVQQGFNPLKIISQQTGKSIATLRGEMEKGQISSEMVTKAMASATQKGGLYYQMMEKQSKTLAGVMSTLKDNTMSLGRELISSLMPAVKKIVDGFASAVGWFRDLGSGTKESIANFALFVASIGPVIFTLAKISAAYKVLQAIRIGLTGATLTGIAAENASTTATAANTLAVKAAAIAQKAWNAIINANPYVLMATAIVAVSGVVAGFVKSQLDGIDDVVQGFEDMKKAQKGTLEVSKDVQKSVDGYVAAWDEIMGAPLTAAEKQELANDKIKQLTAEYEAIEKDKLANMKAAAAEGVAISTDSWDKKQKLLREEISAVKRYGIEVAAAELENQIKKAEKTQALNKEWADKNKQFRDMANQIRFSGEQETEAKILYDKEEKLNKLNELYRYSRANNVAEQIAYQQAVDVIETEAYMRQVNMADANMLMDIDRKNKQIQTEEQVARAKLGMESAVYKGAGMFANAGSQLMNSQNKSLFKVGQIASIANIGMNTADAIVKGYAQLGPIGGTLFAGLMGTVGFVQGQNVMSQKAPGSITPVIPKVDPTISPAPKLTPLAVGVFDVPYDMPAMIHKGETVLPKTFSESMRSGDIKGFGTTINVAGSIIDTAGLFSIVEKANQDAQRRTGADVYSRQNIY